jgi:hypothetical protein
MTTDELREATREFDKEDLSPGRPLRGRMLARWQQAKRKRGRPQNGEGCKVISVSLEKGLLRETDRLARRLKISRARLVAEGLKHVLASNGKRHR